MELDPESSEGKCVDDLFTNFMAKSPDGAVEKLKRVFIFFAPKVINEDSFLCSLYGQEVLDESPLNLRRHLTTGILRVQHAIEMSLTRRKVKELIVALEWSGNAEILAEISKWAKNSIITDGIETSEKNRKCPVDQALQNRLILQRIFAHFPNKFLLSSCSLVNKNWNTESRTFVRDHRTCAASNPTGGDKPLCKNLHELDQMCKQIKDNGRVVPWNCLSVSWSRWNPKCRQGRSIAICTNLVASMKLSQLEIDWSEEAQCPVHMPVSTLLHQKSAELRSLKIRTSPSNIPNELKGWKPHFPQLEEISLTEYMYCSPGADPLAQKTIAQALIKGAPKLKRMHLSDLKSLKEVPEETYGLLTKLDFSYDNAEDEDMFLKIAEKRPALKVLQIDGLKANPYIYDLDDANAVNVASHQLRERLDPVLELLLQRCYSMEEIIVDGYWNPLSQLSFPPLYKLSKLVMQKPFGANIDGFWKAIASIDYSHVMPNVEEVELRTETFDMSTYGEGMVIEYDDTYLDWPEDDENQSHSCCTSVRKLTLQLQVATINLALIKLVFPTVSVLVLDIYHGRAVEVDLPDFTSIWKLWPHLRELHVNGNDNLLERNCDAEFCGIFEEEAELLRGMDANYLELVHIVPIRPSVLTMPRLITLKVNLEFEDPLVLGNQPLAFISKVTELLVLKKMSGKNVSVSWELH